MDSQVLIHAFTCDDFDEQHFVQTLAGDRRRLRARRFACPRGHHLRFLDKGGYEYALALFAVAVSLLFSGGGRYAMDAALMPRAVAAR